MAFCFQLKRATSKDMVLISAGDEHWINTLRSELAHKGPDIVQPVQHS